MLRLSDLRSLAHRRGLVLAVIATVALGVCTYATTFAIVNAALLREPPFTAASRLAVLSLERRPVGESPWRERWSFARFEQLRARQRSFDDVAAYAPASVTLAVDGNADLVYIERVSPSYFSVLSIGAARGRVFTEDEDAPARTAAVAVIGHRLWTGRLASDPAIVGRTIRVNGVPLTVIGVLPPDFVGLSGRAEAWVPQTLSTQIAYADYVKTNQNFIPVVGRLRAGVDLDTARSELAVLGAAINRELPSDPAHPDEPVTATAIAINDARVDSIVRRSMMVLFGAVTLLHLLASVNVVNLLIGRTAARRREFALRVALGSGTRRLFAQIVGEGLLLGVAGGVVGLLLARIAVTVVTPPASLWSGLYGTLGRFDAPAFGGAELAFGVVVSLATAAFIGLVPAILALRVDIAAGLRAGGRTVSSGALSIRRPTARGLIVGVEAALAALLVIGAGLLLDSFQRVRGVDIGVDPDRVLSFWVIPSEARIPPDQGPEFVSRLLAAITRAPGVEAASVDGGGPLSGSASSTLYIAGRPAPAVGQAPPITRHYVAPDHFHVLGIDVVRGRAIAATDTAASPRVTVISESAARRFWPDQDPIGQRVWFGGGSNFDSLERSAEIVGVVSDVRYQSFDQPANLASFYTPYTQFTYASRMVFVRAFGDPQSIVSDVRRAVASVDPELALRDVQPLSDLVSGSRARRRFDALLFSGFGIAALLLAASGIFAVLAHSIEMRRREFGIRIALGARSGRVVRDVLREGLAFPAAGLAVGIGAALASARVLQASLFETSATDPRVYAGVVLLLLLASAAACAGPAWRATRADPIESLRSE